MRCWILPSSCRPARRRMGRANPYGGSGRIWASRLPKKTSPKRGGRCGATFRGKPFETRVGCRYARGALVSRRRSGALRVRRGRSRRHDHRGPANLLTAICVVEAIYLAEKGRIPGTALERLLRALEEPNPRFVLAPLDWIVAIAVRGVARADVPDLPDRVICRNRRRSPAAARHQGRTNSGDEPGDPLVKGRQPRIPRVPGMLRVLLFTES